jgi:diacylglycerol kinase family enzyme
VPTIMGSDATSDAQELSWTGPDGTRQRRAAVILVANNAYRLGRVIAPGTRPRMDAAVLGVTVVGGPDLAGQHRIGSEWTTPEFAVESDGEVPVGVDGEALTMPAPLVFRSRPAALRVRIAPQHPGASPSVAMPTGARDAVRRLLKVAGGADPLEL